MLQNRALLLSGSAILIVLLMLFVISTYGSGTSNSTSAPKTSFPYQVITQPADNLPQNGSCEAVFGLYELGPNGTFGQPEGTVTRTVTMKNGSFVTTLDFGINVRDATSRWLDMAVRCTPGGEFVKLKPKSIIVTP